MSDKRPEQQPAPTDSNAPTFLMRTPAPPGERGPARPPRPDGSGGTPTQAGPGVPTAFSLRIPGYELHGELGRGGMGVVFLGRHTGLGRDVAIKVVRDGALASQQHRVRFLAEAEAAARLTHPNILQIYDFGESDGVLYCVLEYAPGGSLEGHRPEWPLPPRQAAALVEALARATDYAHRSGVVHRDIKPANVLLSPGQGEARFAPKLADFGLAKLLDEQDPGVTPSGAVVGTPGYMPPEQAAGNAKDVGPTADVYSLGAVLYDLLAGRPPFPGPGSLELFNRICAEPPDPLPSETPAPLAVICTTCLRKHPADRYPSAADLAEDLLRYLNGEPVHGGPSERAAPRLPPAPFVPPTPAAGTIPPPVPTVAPEPPPPKAAAVPLAAAFVPKAAGGGVAAPVLVPGAVVELPEVLSCHGHAGEVQCVAFAPYGGQFLSGGEDGTARLWDMTSGRELTVCRGHAAAVRAVAFDPDDRLFFSAGRDGSLRWWDTFGGKDARPTALSSAAVHHAALSPNGSLAAVACEDHRVRVYDADTGRICRTLLSRRGVHWHLAFTPDGRHLVAACDDGQLEWWDVGGGLLERRFGVRGTSGPGRVPVAILTADGTRVVTAGLDAAVRLLDVTTGVVLRVYEGHGARATAAAVTPDGRWLISGSKSGSLRLWDLLTGRVLARAAQHRGLVMALAISPDGRHAASTGADGSVRLWRLPDPV